MEPRTLLEKESPINNKTFSFDIIILRKKVFIMSHKIYSMTFASIYEMYINKAERKQKTKADVDTIILWLTGYTNEQFQAALDHELTMREFYDQASNFNENASLIKGVVCGVRVEDVEDELMQKIRYMDKLIDELAKGKALEKILRT